MTPGTEYRPGVLATKEERGAILSGMGWAFGMAVAGAGSVVLAWSAMATEELRASLPDLILGGVAAAFVIGAVLLWKTGMDIRKARADMKRARRVWVRAVGAAVGAMLGGVAAGTSFLAGAFFGVFGLCVAKAVTAPGPLEVVPAPLEIAPAVLVGQLAGYILGAMLVVALMGALCGLLWRRQRQPVPGDNVQPGRNLGLEASVHFPQIVHVERAFGLMVVMLLLFALAPLIHGARGTGFTAGAFLSWPVAVAVSFWLYCRWGSRMGAPPDMTPPGFVFAGMAVVLAVSGQVVAGRLSGVAAMLLSGWSAGSWLAVLAADRGLSLLEAWREAIRVERAARAESWRSVVQGREAP